MTSQNRVKPNCDVIANFSLLLIFYEIWAKLGKNYRMIHLTWKCPFWVLERCLFLVTEWSIWLKNFYFKCAFKMCLIQTWAFLLLILSTNKVLVYLGKNYRMIHLTWKLPFWKLERCSFLIWLFILLVLYKYFKWEKCYADRLWVKSKNGLLDSKSFKLNFGILKLLLIFILIL